MQCSSLTAQKHVCAQSRTTGFLPSARPSIQGARVQSARVSRQPVSCRPNAHRLVCKAVAETVATTKNPTSSDKEWFAVVANAEFMLHDVQNESFAEQLREKTRHYKDLGYPIDFYLVSNPAWLDEKFPEDGKKVRRPCVALVSKDKLWTTFMKLRLDRVLMLSLGEMSEEELLKSTGPVPEFKKFENWTAPYSPYAPGWWEPFMKSSN